MNLRGLRISLLALLALLVLVSVCACGSRQDAPRPIGDTPIDDQQQLPLDMYSDDDGDGVPNQDDACPLAPGGKKGGMPHGNGCPDAPIDAGVAPSPQP